MLFSIFARLLPILSIILVSCSEQNVQVPFDATDFVYTADRSSWGDSRFAVSGKIMSVTKAVMGYDRMGFEYVIKVDASKINTSHLKKYEKTPAFLDTLDAIKSTGLAVVTQIRGGFLPIGTDVYVLINSYGDMDVILRDRNNN
ncbi:hypothetical protein [Candidatus Fokinia crypta]|uniref:Uncharacterized protein n=1 Tax=Candidatus Fokinia crypta TaxID=1920990 RepID=A0ABZ0UPV2_9RICK|nr:hypothetical protein [Candidatus Fokinia cryptica]WPX97917.1 hypothetical protein Fokcrypt_00441 [Candidatus Fokinia cryptica]